MTSISALGAGLAGMHAARERLDSAARGASGSSSAADLPQHLVGLLAAEHAFAASAAVIRSADAMTGTLLDVVG